MATSAAAWLIRFAIAIPNSTRVEWISACSLLLRFAGKMTVVALALPVPVLWTTFWLFSVLDLTGFVAHILALRSRRRALRMIALLYATFAWLWVILTYVLVNLTEFSHEQASLVIAAMLPLYVAVAIGCILQMISLSFEPEIEDYTLDVILRLAEQILSEMNVTHSRQEPHKTSLSHSLKIKLAKAVRRNRRHFSDMKR